MIIDELIDSEYIKNIKMRREYKLAAVQLLREIAD